MRLLKTTVTTLEMREPPPSTRAPLPDRAELKVKAMPQITVERYLELYDAVGRPHHWTSRHLPPERLAREIHASDARIHILTADGEAAGWFELEVNAEKHETRIVHFGILPAFRGRGYAAYLIEKAIDAGFAEGATRLTIETNTLDHPAALPLYRKHGFQPVGTRDVQTPAIDA